MALTSAQGVAFLSTTGTVGGMERVVCDLSRSFVERGWQVRTVFPETPDQTALLQWCASQKVAAETNPAVLEVTQPHTWKHVRELRQFLQNLKPDVVNLHYGANFISIKDVLAVRLAGVRRCVVTVHHPTSWKEAGARKRLLTATAAMLVDKVTAISQATYAVLQEAGIPTSKLHLIPCGVRPPQLLLDRAEARRKLGLPQHATIIGCLGRLVPHKGVDDLIGATAAAAGTAEGLFLAVAGDGPERSALEQRASELLGGKARFLGRVPEAHEFLAACDIFVLPSYLEGFGLVYIEAAFHGIPSIGVNTGGVPEAIIDGVTGLLVPPGDNAALAGAIQRLYNDVPLRLALGTAARTRAYSQFTEAVMADGYEHIFR